MLKRPTVLVLDEALSGLDVRAEAEVRTALETFMQDCTLICITHRLSSLRPGEPVIVVERGRVGWTGRYTDAAALPSQIRTSLQEAELQAVGKD